MTPEDRLKERFRCPKCKNANCAVHRVSLPHGPIPLFKGRFLIATCTLCGYTEFYDQAIYECLEEPASAVDTPVRPESSVES